LTGIILLFVVHRLNRDDVSLVDGSITST